VQLHAYDDLRGVPGAVRLVDARRVIPERYLFRHQKTGSWALFADWFRYCVLYEHGGFWADTDVVCLQPLVYAHDEVYAWENEHYINNAVLGLPAGHPLAAWMARCCEQPNNILPYDDARSRLRKFRRRWLQRDRRENVRWGEFGPMGFTQAAHHFGLAERALHSDEFYPNRWQDWRLVFSAEPCAWDIALSRSKALHLCSDMMRRQPGFEKKRALSRRLIVRAALSARSRRRLRCLTLKLDAAVVVHSSPA